MNKKRLIFVLLLGLIAVAILWLVNNRPPEKTVVTEVHPTNKDSATNTGQNDSPKPLSDITATTRLPGELELINKEREQAVENSRADWRTAIEFYGKAVDENDLPVPGVKVRFVWTDLSITGNSEQTALSDANGLFSLRDVRGKNLMTYLSKDGYYVSAKNPVSFNYAGENANFIPAKNNPVIFHLRKRGGLVEPLVATSGRLKLPLDGAPVRINVLTGATDPTSGQISFQCVRTAKVPGEREFGWVLKVSVLDGGILITDEEFPFLAPEEGYQPECTIEMLAERKDDWQNMIERNFMFLLPNKKYGRLRASFIAYNGVLRFESYLNQSGSRNLEYDESVQPKRAVDE